MKKIFALLLTMTMVLSMSITAFAAAGSSITVENAKKGETYKIYKLLDLSLSTDGTAFTYTIMENSQWYAFFSGEGAGAPFVALEENDTINGTKQYVVTAKYDTHTEATWAASLAPLAITYANQTEAVTALWTIEATDEYVTNKGVTFDDLDLGYYMVETSIGTLVALESNNVNIPIKPKNPTRVDKLVKEDSTEAWGKTNTADIGDTVNYKLTLEYIPAP